MNYILRHRLSSEDIDFLNETSYEYDLFNPSVGANDSGWCDMSTNMRVVSPTDRIIFKNVTPQQFTFLKLKYDTRLKPLTSHIDELYNEAQQHNASVLMVIDSESVV